VIEDSGHTGRPMGDYLKIIRRRWWILVAATVIVTGLTYFLSSLQTPSYQATADVLIGSQDIFSSQGNGSSSSKDAAFYAATQAALANNEAIAKKAIQTANVSHLTPQGLLANSSVTPDPTTSIVEFKATYRTRPGAIAVTNSYARAFVDSVTAATNQKIDSILKTDQAQLTQLNTELAQIATALATDKAQNLDPGNDYARQRDVEKRIGNVQDSITTLRQAQVTHLGAAELANPAASAAQLAPNTVRNSIVGVILGLVIGVALVFAREAFDTRVHSADEAAAILGLPLLGRLPRPDKELRRSDRLALMVDPGGHASETYRKLRVSLEFANLDPQAKVILTTSAVPQEGKSTTAGNLAVAIASAGKRVILVDLDLRAPYTDRFFGISGRAGLTHVILGQVGLDEALVPVVVPGAATAGLGGNGDAPQQPRALLHVLPAGEMPQDPSSLLASQRLAALLDELRGRADVVIVDTPPVLPVSDTLSLMALADGYLVVSRLDLVRRGMLHEMRRELEQAQAVGLGAIVTDADSEAGYGYGYGGYGVGGYAEPATRTRAG
jgi:polysaccharide biosynthesis transport protein